MPEDLLTANDYERSRTSFNLPTVVQAVQTAMADSPSTTILDIGCGFGGIAATLRTALKADEAYGVDIDASVIEEAHTKGVEVTQVDVQHEVLPYADASFDLVTCFGMLDYLPLFDGVMTEISRTLRRGGLVAVALPNLASWHNRVALMAGYQPRDVEFSSTRVVGVAPYYGTGVPVGHIHTATTRAFRQFMSVMGFDEVRVVPLRPRNNRAPAPVRMIDGVLSRFPSTARRFLYIGRCVREPERPSSEGWWASAGRMTNGDQQARG